MRHKTLKQKVFEGTLANMVYFTLPVPKILWEYLEPIQELPSFTVYRYTPQKGVVFRIPNGIKDKTVICHFFVEHEVNLTNTLKSGNLSLKIQITLVPVECGEFQGFENLNGKYIENEFGNDYFEEGWFKPDYSHPENITKIKPLPPVQIGGVIEGLKELLFCYGQDIIESTKIYMCNQAAKVKKTVFVYDESNDCIRPSEEEKSDSGCF